MASIRDCLSEAVRKVNFDVVEKLLESYNPFYTSTNANQTKRFKLSNSDAEKYIYNLLCDAINAKSLKMFDFLLSNGFVLIDDTSKRVPLLHKAVESGSEDIVKLLLLRGANVRSKDNNGRTPLHLAATKGHLEIAKFLLLNGANVNAKTYSGQSALHEAIKMNHKELAEILISNKADVNAKSRFCEHESRWSTPLYKALEIGSVDLVKLLLSNGASPQFIRYNSRAFLDDADSNFHKGCVNALTLAVAKGNEEVVKLLIQLGMNVNSSDYRGSAMHLALENKHEEIFLYLLNNGGDVTVQCNADLLQLAASRGLLKSVEKLLELGVDCNSWDCNGKTPLMFAAGSGHVEIVKLLLENGACVLKHDKDRNTAFSHAALISHREIVELMAKEFEEMIEESEDEDWCEQIKSILQHAIQKGHDTVVEVFTEHGYLEILEEESDDEESEEEDSMVLHCAAEGGHLEMMKMLLSEGSDVNAEDSAGGTPLHSATCTGEKEAVILLLKNGADIDAIDMFSTTPLLNAIDFGHADVVQILMEYGADIDISDNNDRKALQVAYEESDEIVETMIKVLVKRKFESEAVSNSSWRFIKSREELFTLFKKCEKEIRDMKGEKIAGTNKILYNFFQAKDTQKLMVYTENARIFAYLKAHSYNAKFPLYAGMIQEQYIKVLQRYDLLNKVKNFFASLTDKKGARLATLPVTCTNVIFSYLNDEDLNNLKVVSQLFKF